MKRRAKFEAERIEQAVLVEGYDGMLFAAGIGGEYFESAEQVAEGAEILGLPVPEFAYCCEDVDVRLHADRIIEDLCEDLFEDAEDQLHRVDEFTAAVDAFNTVNSGMECWTPDYTRKVRVRAPEATR